MAEHSFFEGWYFKQQSAAETVAFIPAHHRAAGGAEHASLQIITERAAYQLDYPIAQFHVTKSPFSVAIGNSRFSLDGCHIDCAAGDTAFFGDLLYTAQQSPRWDIMGPFQFVPLLQCRHSLLSLHQRVEGTLRLGERTLLFRDGRGYIEGDRGSSFPRRYLWTQCTWPEGALMLSLAEIPLCAAHFSGCIAALYFEGKIYRFATYLGAKILRMDERGAAIGQGAWRIYADLEQARAQPLRAPSEGAMSRTIYESAACTVRYRVEKGGKTLLCATSAGAGFEFSADEK